MPSPDHFIERASSIGTRLRERPLTLAAGALVCGALLGGLAVYQPAGSTRDVPTRTAETTGSNTAPAETAGPSGNAQAVASQDSGTVDCDQQTWPYLSRECAEHKRRSLRVVTTDRIAEPVMNAIEAPAPAADPRATNPANKSTPAAVASAPQPVAPAPAKTPAPTTGTAPAAVPPSTPPPKVAATTVREAAVPPPAPPKAAGSVARPAPAPKIAAVEPSTATPPSTSNTIAADESSKEVSKKTKRKKSRTRDHAKEADLETQRAEEDSRVREPERGRDSDRRRERDRTREADRSRDSDELDERDRTRERAGGGAHIAERWIEREYDRPAEDRPGRRKRVIIIDRDDRYVERSERDGGFLFGGGGFPFRF
jgi:hypothetical protein